MRKLWAAALVTVALLLVHAEWSEAGGRHRHHWHGGTRIFLGVGPAFWYAPYYAPYPYWYYPPYHVYTPPTVIVQDPPVYVQQEPTTAAPPAPPAAESYWYYCPGSREYYPRVPSCSEPWIKVPPRQE
jgi:hypothetical protein